MAADGGKQRPRLDEVLSSGLNHRNDSPPLRCDFAENWGATRCDRDGISAADQHDPDEITAVVRRSFLQFKSHRDTRANGEFAQSDGVCDFPGTSPVGLHLNL